MAHIKAKCDFCDKPAYVDGATKMGPWAYMCQEHFEQNGIKREGLYTLLDPAVVPTKVCRCCGEEKPVTEFYQYTDGRGVKRYRTECKFCNLVGRKTNGKVRK